MATTFAATVNGKEFKRTSKGRTYTHAIVARSVVAHMLAQASSTGWTKTDRSNFQYYTQQGDARVAGLTMDQYVAAKLAERVAAVEADPCEWGVYGWAGSEALAVKAMREPERYGMEARVVPVGFVGTL